MERLTLMSIVEAFNAPINEEHAWSVCYQCAQHLRGKWENSAEKCRRFNGIEAVELCKDGTVSTIHSSEEAVDTEYDLLQALGVAVFQALDYGLSEGQEQSLSPALELLITRMTGSESDDEDDDARGADAEDEGIGGDDDRGPSALSLAAVIQMCSDHLGAPQEAASHYRAVCRALVSEAVELSSFLEKIDHDKTQLKSDDVDGETRLEELQRADWARLWRQMMLELRNGVKLKKVNLQSHRRQQPVECEMTPYEVLMADIRLRRYTLNRVTVNAEITPRTRKDAHAVMLDFIRSRPPLHSAKERKLASPPPRQMGKLELLMEDIRGEHTLTLTPRGMANSRGDGTPARKVIKLDASLLNFDFNDEDDDDDDDNDRNKVEPLSPISPFSPLSPTSPPSYSKTDCSVDNRDAVLPPRTSFLKQMTFDSNTPPRAPPPRARPAACLSLTVEEVMHIRRVLTKAELECLLTDPVLHDLLSRGKVCFTCKQTRFSLFQWSSTCKFCGRNVCAKCVTKMRISADDFDHVPVHTLSPGSPSCAPILSGPYAHHDVFSHKTDSHHGGWRPPMQRAQTVALPSMRPLPRIPAAPPSGPQRNVCRDCRAMIASIVRASHWSAAGRPGDPAAGVGVGGRAGGGVMVPSRDFHLDLKPVYLSSFRKIMS